MRKVALKIEGMSCGHCVRAVEAALGGVSGAVVRQVQIGSAEVEVNDDLAVGVLIDVLSDVGYSADEQRG